MNNEMVITNEPLFYQGMTQYSPLYSPLVIDPMLFIEMYNLDISEYVEKKPGGRDGISYLSYSHAIRLFKTNFPDLEVTCEVNPKTGSYIFEEAGDAGFFVKPYIHNGKNRTAWIYYPVLNHSNNAVLPSDTDKNERVVANTQTFNKSILRGITKVIAQVTGIGLKLWTGDDLSPEILDAKYNLLSKVKDLANRYQVMFGKPYPLPNLDYTTTLDVIKQAGKELTAALKEQQTTLKSESKPVPDAVPGESEETLLVKA